MEHWNDQKLWYKLLGVYIGLEVLIYGYTKAGINQRLNDQLGAPIL